MAKSGAVWGIDIGQSALKALRCRPHESDEGRLVVEAFDYIEYPKLLSQPDAEPEEIVRDAIATFLERNELKGDHVAMSVPGQAGLARFIKLPPVEQKKIPDIVKYEARQQIPFQLEDVVWDYQPLAGGNQEEGYALETEIGLFAMKRDQVARSLEPLRRAGIEIDYIQLAPLALYNYVCFDRLGELLAEPYDPENPPRSVVLLSLGVDTTDLVVTNGFRVWQRSIQIGGSHFTKALTKELKLTFGKAEHLKKNAAKAEDPKAVFQAMRPVFSDLVAEIQRSIGFFMSNNRGAELSEVIAVGNAMKLPGLQRYLAQNLDIPVKMADEFDALAGGSVTAQPAFQQNQLSFPVAYGLCVQGLGRAQMGTNLLPDEIVMQRVIRAKKPWAVAAAAALMAGLAINYSGYVSAYQTVDVENDWKQALSQSQQVAQRTSGWTSANQDQKTKFDDVLQIGNNLASNVDGRLLWPELWSAINAAIPQDKRPEEERKQTAEDVSSREEIHITSLDCKQFDDLSTWFATVSPIWEEAQQSRDRDAAATPTTDPAAEVDPAAEGAEAAAPVEPPVDEYGGGAEYAEAGGAGAGPTGPGWVIQLRGHHFHNSRGGLIGQQFVRETLIENLISGKIQLPDGEIGPDGKPELIDVTFEELGIGYPVVVTKRRTVSVEYDPEALEGEEAGRGRRTALAESSPRLGGRPGADAPAVPELWKLQRYDFVVQFSWKPTLRHSRDLARKGLVDGAAEAEGY
ncbi:Competence protein A [Botrimarina colliarenosi]|uniref:Competence protein A n=1 Tax=Botrimarina colliarenosi TaxID=2528001 RepID=A0A5C6A7Y9_9BACT|nr:type IV pilus assembly protein PilM [Botrimarina colliarenosi]TWT96064.1 Competence protein A [Botrimarina colliarenosi]